MSLRFWLSALFIGAVQAHRQKIVSPQPVPAKLQNAMNLHKETDLTHTLVQRLKAQDPSALSYLYDHYSAALMGIISRTLGPSQEATAEEVLHDVFMKIWHQIQQYDASKGTLFTWMYRIAKNAALDMRRSKNFKASEKSVELDISVYQSVTTTQETDITGLREIIKQMTKDCYELVYMNFFAGYSHTDIAEKEDIPLGTVKTRLRKCLGELRKLMQTPM